MTLFKVFIKQLMNLNPLHQYKCMLMQIRITLKGKYML